MAIDKLQFGKNLRPSTVDVMNKVNEIIDTIDDIGGDQFEQLSQKVQSLETTSNNHTAQITQIQADAANLEKRVATNETDLENVKITLYTPLSSTENN